MTEMLDDAMRLRNWAVAHSDGPVEDFADHQLSVTKHLLRFQWNGAFTVLVAHRKGDGKARINALLDALAIAQSGSKGDVPSINLILGTTDDDVSLGEHLGAVGTLIGAMQGGPAVSVWTIRAGQEPQAVSVAPSTFTSGKPKDWGGLLLGAASASIDGVAAEVAERLADRPSFALYPKLTSIDAARPWQMRLDGLEIGRVGADFATLRLASTNINAPGKPRDQWRDVIKAPSLDFGRSNVGALVELIDELISAWKPKVPGGVLDHGQAEHALEAHILSGRATLHSAAGPLRLAVPYRKGMLGAAQFPTLWGDVTSPARYLDALLADHRGRPWAIELKDQDAGGGYGAYLRHGIGQAVLYRHYIRACSTVPTIADWFAPHGLRPAECLAAVAFPTASPAASVTIERHRQLAALFDVEVIEFPRPGAA